MKIVIAPDSFKDCLSAAEVAANMAEGIYRVDPTVEIEKIPVADGGEGFVDTMLDALGGDKVALSVLDPLGRQIDSFYGILGDDQTAVIEMAAASGIEHLTRAERNPLVTSTFGTGQLIKDALKKGCTKIIIGIGGSATNDGGTGMAKALGYRFLDDKGVEIAQGGGDLFKLASIETSGAEPLLKKCEILVACDVTNPLTGERGASAVYGPQKGATAELVALLDVNLTHLASVIANDLSVDVLALPGGGAAGGLGAGLVAFCGGTLQAGFDIVSDITGLEQAIESADLVFTGEGKMDGQTKQGKTPWGVAQIAQKYEKPIVGVAGFLGEGYRELYEEGFTAVFALPNGPTALDVAISDAPELLQDAGERIYRLINNYL